MTPTTTTHQASAGMLLAVLAVLALFDHAAGANFSLRLFYLMPVALAACVFGRKGGTIVAGISTAFCVFVEAASRIDVLHQMPAIAWDGFSSCVLFMLFADVVSHYCSLTEELPATANQARA